MLRAKYKSSANIHAKHDKKLLETITDQTCEVKTSSSLVTKSVSFATDKDESTIASRTRSLPSVTSDSSQVDSKLMKTSQDLGSVQLQKSNVCCEDPDDVAQTMVPSSTLMRSVRKPVARSDNTQFVPPPPPNSPLFLKIGILTVSDRAAAGGYETGDLSGPAVEQSLAENIGKSNSYEFAQAQTTLSCNFTRKGTVSDDIDEIEKTLLLWSSEANGDPVCDVIFTTGGTGFSSRDVTPEATKLVIERECKGLMTFVLSECSKVQPLAALSRGTAGVTGKTIIVNLPGNPDAVSEILNILFPLLLHAVKDLQQLS